MQIIGESRKREKKEIGQNVRTMNKKISTQVKDKFINLRNTANLKKINTIKITYRHISVKLQQTKDKEKLLKAI